MTSTRATRATIPSTSDNVAVLQGSIAGEPRRTVLTSGAVVHEYDVRVTVPASPEFGPVTVPVSWFDRPAAGRTFSDGDQVVVVGSVRRRFYRAGGATVSRTDVVAREVIAAGRRQAVRRAIAGVVDQLQRSQ